MKKLLHFVLACTGAGLWLTACQPQTKPASLPQIQAQPETKPSAGVNAQPSATPKLPVVNNWEEDRALAGEKGAVEIGPSVKDVPAFLATNNLAPLWQADFGQQENHSRPTILDGFYGAEHRHISFIFDRVAQDSGRPNLFRVQGRSRFRKNIIPFDGTITVEGIKSMEVFLELDSADQARVRAYTATAHFILREDPTATGAGTFQGTARLDFYRLGSDELSLVQTLPDEKLPAGGGGHLFRGQWRSNQTGRQQVVAFATYPQAVLPSEMTDFYLGDRGETINPKYAKLDWSEAWENNEWWAKSPKPSLSL